MTNLSMIAQVLNKLCLHVEADHLVTIPLPPTYAVRIILHMPQALVLLFQLWVSHLCT